MQGSWRSKKNIKKHNREKSKKEEAAVGYMEQVLKRAAAQTKEHSNAIPICIRNAEEKGSRPKCSDFKGL